METVSIFLFLFTTKLGWTECVFCVILGMAIFQKRILKANCKYNFYRTILRPLTNT